APLIDAEILFRQPQPPHPEPFGSFAFRRRGPVRGFLVLIFGATDFLLKVYLIAPGTFQYAVVTSAADASFLILPCILVVGDNFSIPALAACWTVAFDYHFFVVSSHLPSPMRRGIVPFRMAFFLASRRLY